MKIQWLGHNCFILTSHKGSSILLDPYSSSIQLPFPDISPDIVVISHEHPENNAAWRVNGTPLIAKRTSPFPCEHELHIPRTEEIFLFKGIPTFHDDILGKSKGPNTVFVWQMDRFKICFLGDIGHVLDEKQAAAIGTVDILFIPVGGHNITIGSKEAAVVIDQLRPSLIIPMNYKHEAIPWDIEPLDTFLAQMHNIERLNSSYFEFSSLPATVKVLVFALPEKLLERKQGG